MNGRDLVREIRAISDERVDNLLRCDYIEGIMSAFHQPMGTATNLKSTTTCGVQEDNMNERLTRKELTARVKELENSKIDELYKLRMEIKNLERELGNIGEKFAYYKQVAALIEFLGLEYKYVCGTEGRWEFSKKKVRKPSTRKR